MEGGPNITQYKKGLWTLEEDRMLMDYISVHGSGKWNRISKLTGLKRNGKSCRLRWMNYLSPSVKRDDFSEEEDDLIIRLHNLLGNRWSLIAGRVPGRTDNQVKNHWNTHLSKKLGIKKGKSKARASSGPRVLEENICVPSLSSSDDHQLQAAAYNGSSGTEAEVAKVSEDGSQRALWLTGGMWEKLMDSDNHGSSFSFANEEINLHSPYLLVEPLQDYCPLGFVWDGF